jgi:prefoldin subunit 5
MQQQRREIDQVSQEIGKLQGQYDALAKGQEKLTGDVGELSNMVRSLSPTARTAPRC